MASSTSKVVYLVRHAESLENVALRAARASYWTTGLAKYLWKIARGEMVDADVSPDGAKQIAELGERVRADDFLRRAEVQLVAHSPLKRAKQTCFGLFGYDAADNAAKAKTAAAAAAAAEPPPAGGGATAPAAGSLRGANRTGVGVGGKRIEADVDPDTGAIRLGFAQSVADPATGTGGPGAPPFVELDCLRERTPAEYVPGVGMRGLDKRISAFHAWLAARPEARITVVGHSQYFRRMLGGAEKQANCDVWRVPFVHANDPELLAREEAARRAGQRVEVAAGDGGGGDADGGSAPPAEPPPRERPSRLVPAGGADGWAWDLGRVDVMYRSAHSVQDGSDDGINLPFL